MQFKVPQFIDIEDKIFGPFTFRQFIYLVGGAGLVYLSVKLLPFFLGALLAIPLAAFALALAFIKVNEKPFIHAVEAFLTFYSRSRLYLWKKVDHVVEKHPSESIEQKTRDILTESKLKTLSWSLNVIDPKK